MILAARVRGTRENALSQALSWAKARPWFSVVVILTMWCVFPLVRRVIDWKVGAAAVSLISIIPLAALLPFLLPLVYGGNLRKLDRGLGTVAWLWLGGFTFSLAMAILAGKGGAAAALYTYLQFILPAAFGVWFATTTGDVRATYERIANFLLWLSTPLSLYAIFQFVRPPAWDVQWMIVANIVSIGKPLPFQLRPFSTLNGPGTFADFLIVVVLLNLPRLKTPKPAAIAQMGLALAALAITLVRSNWAALVLGVVVYIAISPGRARNFNLLAATALVLSVFVFNASSLLGDASVGSGLQQRLDTFSNLGNDTSYNERSQYFNGPLQDALATPLGQGLGVTGTAAKIGNAGKTQDFDDGYIARFVEMGYFGTACYLAAVFAALAFAVRRWRAFKRMNAEDLAGMAAGVIGVQVALIGLDLSSDHHNALPGLFFWISLALIGSCDASAFIRRGRSSLAA